VGRTKVVVTANSPALTAWKSHTLCIFGHHYSASLVLTTPWELSPGHSCFKAKVSRVIIPELSSHLALLKPSKTSFGRISSCPPVPTFRARVHPLALSNGRGIIHNMETPPKNLGADSESNRVESLVEVRPATKAESFESGEDVFESLAEDASIIDTEETVVAAATARMEEEADGSLEELPDEVRWKRAYEEESVKQWNDFEDENPDKVDKYREEQERWYEKARAKAEQVIKGLDPEYVVTVQDSIVSPDDNDRAEYRTSALAFTSPRGPVFSWSMEVGMSEHYIQNDLPDVIKKIYARKQEGIFEHNTGTRNVDGIQNIKFDFPPTRNERCLAKELDQMDKLEEIRAGLSVESGDDSQFLRRALLKFRIAKHFIMNKGTIRQRTLEIAFHDETVTVKEKVARDARLRTWTIGPSGTVVSPEGASGVELKHVLKALQEQIRTGRATSEVTARPKAEQQS